MPVHIEQDMSGRLILDISSEQDLAENTDFGSILIPFNVVYQTPYRLLLDLGGDIIDALEYLQRSLHAIDVTVNLSDDLNEILQRARAEIDLLEELMQLSVDEQAHRREKVTLNVPDMVKSSSLLSHQRRGLMRSLNVNNLAEFSVQGAGKTAIILSAFSIWKKRGEIDKLLVIGPLSCFVPWETEVQRCFGNKLQTMRWSGAIPQRLKLVPRFGIIDIILCSYDTARSDVLMLRRLLKEYRTLLVLDESHYIKNINIGARAAAVMQLSRFAAKRMILTGTPVPHSLQDLWSQFNFLWPSGSRRLLGNVVEYQDFISNTTKPAKELRERLAPFYHRTTEDELNLPEAQPHIIQIHSDEIPVEQQRIIRLLEYRVASEARLQLPRTMDRQVLAQWQRARITRLLQAVSNPGLLHSRPEWPIALVGDVDTSDLLEDVIRFQSRDLISAKIEWTINKVKELIDKGEKVLVWTWWVDNLYLLRDILTEYNPLLLYGAIKPYEEETDEEEEQSRERNIREFRTRDDCPLLIANPSACAESISLHIECHNAIYVDRTFNCGQFLQSLNRIHRVGLPEGITTHYWIPIIDCVVERVVDTRLRERQRVMYEFLGDETPVIGIDLSEENEVIDSNEELNRDFQQIIGEINSDHPEESTG